MQSTSIDISTESIDTMPSTRSNSPSIDPLNNLYPNCIVFGVLPLITWLIPVIGHIGIGDSNGHIHDFAGSCHIGYNQFMTGRVTKYYHLDQIDSTILDRSIIIANNKYNKQHHNIISNNCHHHVSDVLRATQLPQYNNVTMLQTWWLITVYGRYSTWAGLIYTWLPFCSILIAALLMGFLIK